MLQPVPIMVVKILKFYSVPYICSLFVTNNHQMKMEGRNKVVTGKLAFQSVSYKFRIQLQELLDRLVNTVKLAIFCKTNELWTAPLQLSFFF